MGLALPTDRCYLLDIGLESEERDLILLAALVVIFLRFCFSWLAACSRRVAFISRTGDL